MSSNKFLEESRSDIVDDCDEILWLAQCAQKKVTQFLRDAQREKTYIPASAITQANAFGSELLMYLQKEIIDIASFRKKFLKEKISSFSIRKASATLLDHRIRLRSIYGVVGAVCVSLDWQSPSFDFSQWSQAGVQRGKIEATVSDYKRDHHFDAEEYEKEFFREYVDAPLKMFGAVYACSSGMAAFTTAIQSLIGEGKAGGSILAGRSIYFENKELLSKWFGSRLIDVDEFDTDEILATCKKYQPSVITFDTIGNTGSIAAPDLDRLIPSLGRLMRKDTYIILDNTSASVLFQPLAQFRMFPRNIHLIVIESLNKFHQFGFDRVTGGIAWGIGKGIKHFFSYRMHLGTNIPDASVHSLPFPNRALLERRLRRHGRNAAILAARLHGYCGTGPSRFAQCVIYPGIDTYPGYAWMRMRTFQGAFLSLRFKEKFRTGKAYQRFVSGIMRRARHANVPLAGGTSFGLSSTRAYLTALHAKTVEPFVRISAGTETRLEIEQIADIIQAEL